MDKFKKIGVIHSLTQIVLFGIYSSGRILLLPLALAEITGWIMLALWIGFNFIALPFIIQTIEQDIYSYFN